MIIVDPSTGKSYLEKRRRRYSEPNQPRELTFSCYRRFPFLERNRTREWFREALEDARTDLSFQIWAYVVMPEHIHLLVNPGETPERMSEFLQAVKEPIARQAIRHLKANAPEWLARITVRESARLPHRFWQPGGGYDRNVRGIAALRAMIDYIHANPVRRGLVAKAEDWEWSSARWFAGIRPVKIAKDNRACRWVTSLQAPHALRITSGRATELYRRLLFFPNIDSTSPPRLETACPLGDNRCLVRICKIDYPSP
ncbi:MAG: transposase [Planctomycetes bacterium]|nr:transposase [Planctomycetota bacterium]